MQRKWVQLYREQGVSTAHSSVSTPGGVQGQELDFDDPFQLRIIQTSDSLLIFVVGHSNNSPDQTGTTQFRGQGARKSLTICFYKREWRVVSVLIQPGVQPGLGPKAPSPAAKGAAETMKSLAEKAASGAEEDTGIKVTPQVQGQSPEPQVRPQSTAGSSHSSRIPARCARHPCPARLPRASLPSAPCQASPGSQIQKAALPLFKLLDK